VVDGTVYGPANDVARELVRDPRLADGVRLSPAGWQRRSCCLFYRAGNGLCGDCSLDRLPRRPPIR
jgi:ferric iron reductase protein FhuF